MIFDGNYLLIGLVFIGLNGYLASFDILCMLIFGGSPSGRFDEFCSFFNIQGAKSA
jgi:hypothetical protein